LEVGEIQCTALVAPEGAVLALGVPRLAVLTGPRALGGAQEGEGGEGDPEQDEDQDGDHLRLR